MGRGKILKILADLLNNQLSEHAEDWPNTMPESALVRIELHNNKIRSSVIDMREIYKQ